MRIAAGFRISIECDAIVGIENRDRQIVAIRDLDRADDERILRREEFMPALVARTDFVEDAMRDKSVENFAERGDRCQRLRPVAAGIDDFQRTDAAGSQNFRVLSRCGACAVTRGREETLRMLSIPDMAILGAAALIFFGPEQLPKVARKVGLFMRDVQNTSQSFIREMERAADEPPHRRRTHVLRAAGDTSRRPTTPAVDRAAAYDGSARPPPRRPKRVTRRRRSIGCSTRRRADAGAAAEVRNVDAPRPSRHTPRAGAISASTRAT